VTERVRAAIAAILDLSGYSELPPRWRRALDDLTEAMEIVRRPTPLALSLVPSSSAAAAAERKRDEAIARAAAAAPEGWAEEAMSYVRLVASRQERFTTDDLWAAGLSRPPNGRALGGVMLAAARAGLIWRTSDFTISQQPSRNAAPVRVWRSLLRITP
jgi:hypothetical protein